MSESRIHPTAVISDEAEIGEGVEIGPYAVVEGKVKLGAGNILESHARVGSRYGEVVMGENNHVFSGTVLGSPPQHLHYRFDFTRLEIGSGNRFCEHVTVNLGGVKDDGVTRIGDDCLLMAGVHIAHDCKLADRIIITNQTLLAGHVNIGNNAVLAGRVGVAQFCRIGEYCFLTAHAIAQGDIAPFTIARGDPASSRAVNKIGMQRGGLDDTSIRSLKTAVRLLVRGDRSLDEALKEIEAKCEPCAELTRFVAFLQASEKGVSIR